MKYYNVLIMALTSVVMMGFWQRLRSRLPRWNVLSNSQKVALVSFISLTLMLPIITLATLEGTRLTSRAATPVITPPTPPTTPTPTPSPTPTPTLSPTPTPARSIQVKLPNGGETLYVGQTYRISWDSSSNIDKVWLGYSAGPGSLDWIATNIPNTGYYDWKVFVGNTTNTKFKIDITGYQTGYGSARDQSDNFFTVLSSPPPTLTPTPSPTPILTPTPTPSPTPNAAPQIRTWFLPPGRINRNYRSNIVGTDRNKNDNLTLTTAGLPPGITQGPCSTDTQGSNARIKCVLSGRPAATGVYPVHVVLVDNHGGKAENDIFIIIYNLFGLF